MKLDNFDMPEAPDASEEFDLGLDEMELESDEDPEIAEMITKLEELGYKVEKIEDSEAGEFDDEMPPADDEDYEI